MNLERQLSQLKAGVRRELDDGGFRLGPVKSRLLEMLADFSSYQDSAVADGRQLLQQHEAQIPANNPPDQSSNSTSEAVSHWWQAPMYLVGVSLKQI